MVLGATASGGRRARNSRGATLTRSAPRPRQRAPSASRARRATPRCTRPPRGRATRPTPPRAPTRNNSPAGGRPLGVRAAATRTSTGTARSARRGRTPSLRGRRPGATQPPTAPLSRSLACRAAAPLVSPTSTASRGTSGCRRPPRLHHRVRRRRRHHHRRRRRLAPASAAGRRRPNMRLPRRRWRAKRRNTWLSCPRRPGCLPRRARHRTGRP
mmetsp:Transcript_41910/g.135955  ORF Transcript_41910/g.135955 Transcript_41910/m.135955 type:complete len:214 (-) Transcript_41910:293-934(-)